MQEKHLILLHSIIWTIVNDEILFDFLMRSYADDHDTTETYLERDDLYTLKKELGKTREELKQSKTPRLDITIMPRLTIEDINI